MNMVLPKLTPCSVLGERHWEEEGRVLKGRILEQAEKRRD
jgi:hypothetical protein